jgi:hypothetical protein
MKQLAQPSRCPSPCCTEYGGGEGVGRASLKVPPLASREGTCHSVIAEPWGGTVGDLARAAERSSLEPAA